MSYILPSDAIASVIYFQLYLDTSKDIVVSFDYACYGTNATGSEGFCVFFANTISEAIQYGGPGPGLGYSAVSGVNTVLSNVDSYRGMDAAMLGVGFDITGNFGSSLYFNTGYNNLEANTIALRDAEGEGFNLLTRTKNINSTNFDKSIELYQQIDNKQEPIFKRVRVRLTDFGQRIIVDLKSPGDLFFTNYLDYAFNNKTWPTTVRCGLSFATGESTDTIFKIKGFNINGAFSTAEGKNQNTYVYDLDPTAFAGSAILWKNPSKQYFNVDDILKVENQDADLSHVPIISGGPLITVDPIDGPRGAPYEPGDNYVTITTKSF